MVERTTDRSVSRRSVLKTAGGLLAGGTLLSGQGAANHGRSENQAQSRRAWKGVYDGWLDGRKARLFITSVNYKTLRLNLKDLDRHVMFRGETPVPTGRNDHVIKNLRLESADGRHAMVERFYKHGFTDTHTHISGHTRWRGTTYGLAFASSGFRASAGDGPRFDSDDWPAWPDQWESTYRGRNDGRRADLTIRVIEKTTKNNTSARFFIELYDRERENRFRGVTDKNRNSTSHIMSDLTLQTDDGQKKTIDRLYLHTWDTHYVSGRTEWRGNYYGCHFAQEY